MRYLTHWREHLPGSRTHIGNMSEGVLPMYVRERWILWGIFFLLLVLVFFWAPILLLEPRLWAEEASLFLLYAYTHDFLDSLLLVSHAGYFSLACTLPATIAAHLFPLAYAPVVTTYFSLGILLTLFALILWGHSSVWDTLGKKTLACLILLFAPSSIGEVWLNSINIMSYGAVISACLLVEDLRTLSPRRRWGYRLLLIFCGLSGVYTTFLGGMFLLKAWLEKSRESLIHLGLVTCTSLIQVPVFLHMHFANRISPTKLAGLHLGETGKHWFLAQFALPVLGLQGGKRLQTALGVFVAPSGDILLNGVALLSGLLALGYLCVVLFTIRPQPHQHSQILLLGSYAFTAIGTSVFSMHGNPAGRYAVASGIFLLWMLLNNLRAPICSDARAFFAAGLLATALVIGVTRYRTYGARQYFVCGAGCPQWADELKRCELNGECLLTVWPYPRWKFTWPVRPAVAAPR